MLRPEALKKGDKIAVIAPSSPIKEELLREGVRTLKKRFGFEVEEKGAFLGNYFFCNGSPEQRWKYLKKALEAPDIKGIWAARGGAGSWQLLKFLEGFEPSQPKVLAGSSDFTFILLFALQRWKWVVFYAPMVATKIARRDFSADSLGFLKDPNYRFRAKLKPIKEAEAEGPLTGGTLSILVSTLSTPYEVETSGKILLIEDWQEKPYRVERMLWQLAEAGKFDEVKGVVFSDMPGCLQHPQQGYELEELLDNFFRSSSFPVLFGLKTGHSREAETLALGINYRIDGQEFYSTEPAVRT